MILMGSDRFTLTLFNIVMFLTFSPGASAQAPKIQVPACPPNTTREYYPDLPSVNWTVCKDKVGYYQGIMIQFSQEKEVIRIASVKDSERDGREVRAGYAGFLEERIFKNGHLEGPSYVYESHSTIGKIIPKLLDQAFWDQFTKPTPTSLMRGWLNNQAPHSTMEFTEGRLSRLQFGAKDYKVRIAKDKRMFFDNHPEMKDSYFFDPEALWLLSPSDTKAALMYGFGSCKKYTGPLGRFGRHYDMLIFKQESSEVKHERKLKEIRERFLGFCVPQDIREHLGKMECPPQLPTTLTPAICRLPISDQLHLPFQNKFFKFEYTLGRSPEELNLWLKHSELNKFRSRYEVTEDVFSFSPQFQIKIKKTSNGVLFHPVERDEKGRIRVKKNNADGSKDWWEWHRLPGF